MKNSLIIDENGLLEMFSSTDDGTNALEVNETEIPSSSWVGSGNYTFTIGGQTYTIAKASSSTGNWQLIQDSDYTFHFQRILTMREEFLNLAYPVGSIYMSVNSTSPATLFGGTWQRITGRFLLAATDNGSSGASQAAGNTGGAATVTLTAAQSGNQAQTITSKGMSANASHSHGPSDSGYRFMHSHGSLSGGDMSGPSGSGRHYPYQGNRSDGAYWGSGTNTASASVAHTHQVEVAAKDATSAHNNMPPYLAVYVWKRTA